MVGCSGQELNRSMPPPPAPLTPPPQAGEEIHRATRQELSDGLEQVMKAEGVNIAPDRPDGREDKKNGGR